MILANYRMKQVKKHIILLFMGISAMGCQTNWYENFSIDSKDPFGIYIFHQEVKSLFHECGVENLTVYFDDFYEDAKMDKWYMFQQAYISIRDKNYSFDNENFDKLIDYVEAGNIVFLAYNEYDNKLCELLEIETTNKDSARTFSSNMKYLEGLLTLKSTDKTYEYDRNLRFHYISDYNPETTQVLGSIERDGESFPCFIKIKFKNGYIFIHTQPIVFTNYYLLKRANKRYVERVFSMVNYRFKTFWDGSPKYKRNRDQENEPPSALSFFMNHTALRWSLLTGLFGIIAFILVNMRRKQRPIPKIEPLKNTTVEFTRTMANLYQKENKPKVLIDKKISFFLHAVRQQYLLDTNQLDQPFIEKLAAKSGNNIEQTSILIKAISRLKEVKVCDEDELIRLNKLIENFFEQL